MKVFCSYLFILKEFKRIISSVQKHSLLIFKGFVCVFVCLFLSFEISLFLSFFLSKFFSIFLYFFLSFFLSISTIWFYFQFLTVVHRIPGLTDLAVTTYDIFSPMSHIQNLLFCILRIFSGISCLKCMRGEKVTCNYKSTHCKLSFPPGFSTHVQLHLRILASYVAKTAKICNFWTFWRVIQLINHLFKRGIFAQRSIDVKNAVTFTSIERWPKRLFVGF